MKQSIGYTVSLNIVIVFIVIIFAFIGATISYYKSYKVNNIIDDSIEKYEGYNDLSKEEISLKLSSVGYNQSDVICKKHKDKDAEVSTDAPGYCVYLNVVSYHDVEIDGESKQFPEYYNYIVKTYMTFDIPIINQLLRIPVYTKTKTMYGCYGNSCEVVE